MLLRFGNGRLSISDVLHHVLVLCVERSYDYRIRRINERFGVALQ